jgi:basic amino acid/polyamine antiporter, APA family
VGTDARIRKDPGRGIGLFPLTNIVVANMIGAGIFTTSGLLMRDLGSPWVMLGLWAVGGIIALCGALSYGELGAAIPRAGGEYAFLSELFHPLLGFMSGWVSFFVGFSAPIAASAIGFTEYFARAYPGMLRPGLLPAGIEAAVFGKVWACLVILIFTAIHARGIEFGSRVQSVLTIGKVVLIAGLITAGLASGRGDWAHFAQGEAFRFDFSGMKSAGLALMWIMFAYSGWNASAYIGAEIKSPARNLPRSLILGTGIVVLLYAGLNVFYLYALAPARMSGVVSVGGLAAGALFGPAFERVLSVLIGFALFSSLSAFIILGPRVYHSMARDGYFFRLFAAVDPVRGAPSRAIWLQGIISMVIVISGSFSQILTYMGFSLGIFPLLAVLGVFKIRKRGIGRFRMPGFPITPLVYVASGALILVLGFLESPGPSRVAILTVAASVPAYFLFRWNKEKRSGPENT